MKDKKSKFSLKSELRSRSTNFKQSLIEELTGIIDSQRRKTDHTITSDEQSRRDQLLQEEISEQNPALRETRISNMRGMEGLQKSHVLKVEELSRKKK